MNDKRLIPTGNLMLDEILKNGILNGQVNMIIGKPRQIGKSYYNMNYMHWFRAQKRKQTIKSILNI